MLGLEGTGSTAGELAHKLVQTPELVIPRGQGEANGWLHFRILRRSHPTGFSSLPQHREHIHIKGVFRPACPSVKDSVLEFMPVSGPGSSPDP